VSVTAEMLIFPPAAKFNYNATLAQLDEIETTFYFIGFRSFAEEIADVERSETGNTRKSLLYQLSKVVKS